MAVPANNRTLKDATLSKSVALPNAANTVNTNYIDLGPTPYPLTEGVTLLVETSLATGANNKNINVRVQHSDDTNTSNFTNVADIGNPFMQAVANTTKFAAASDRLTLPPGIKRYIRVQGTGEANGGDASDGTLTASLLV